MVENVKQVIKLKKRKSKKTNPLMKAVPVVKKWKAKIDDIEIPEVKADLDYPDDPTFRESQPEEGWY